MRLLPRLIVLFAFLAPGSWWLMKACAPDFLVAVFSYKRHPDLPRTEFINGRLGVLQPTFARSYLIIAYRYLNGIGMNAKEREQARGYYTDRADHNWDRMAINWPRRWRQVRATVRSPAAPAPNLISNGQLAYNLDTHDFVLNCAEDAFRTAVHTFQARRGSYGVRSQAFRDWVGAQDQVFANCEIKKAAIPREAAPELPPLPRADRDYQIAAAYFYAGDYQAALSRFRRISADASSPWHSISRYLVVRTLLRMTDDRNTAVSAGAELQLEGNGILSDANLTSIHGMTWNLLERAQIRKRDQTYFRALARLLSSKGQDNGLREELWNYTDIYDGIIDEKPNSGGKPNAVDISRFRDADLSDWLYSFQSRDTALYEYSLVRWQQIRSAAWLLAAISHANGAAAKETGLLDAALKIPEDSPAYLSMQFQIFRLWEESGDRPAARKGLDLLLNSSQLTGLPSSRNLFRGLRMLAAPSFDEFVSFALRKPVLMTLQTDFGEGSTYPEGIVSAPDIKQSRFDHDATLLLNRHVPFEKVKELALSDNIPDELRREALMTVFTRGLMLEENLTGIASKLAEIQPDVSRFAAAYLQESSGEGRRFAAANLLLHRPEARPYFASGISRQSRPGRLDDYRDNWWCPVDVGIQLESIAVQRQRYYTNPNILQDSANPERPGFLDNTLSAQADQEFANLSKLGTATDFLGKIVFEHANLHRDDPRVPEALHNLVRSGHYGCADVSTWKTVRKAFRLLHLQYPKSSWTSKTPTWFKNDYDIRREMKDRYAPAN